MKTDKDFLICERFAASTLELVQYLSVSILSFSCNIIQNTINILQIHNIVLAAARGIVSDICSKLMRSRFSSSHPSISQAASTMTKLRLAKLKKHRPAMAQGSREAKL